MYSAGTAYLTVVPSFRGIEEEFRREAENIGRQVDRTIAEHIPQGVREGFDRADREVDRAARRAGERYAGAFSETMRNRLNKAIGSFREVEITADSSDLDRALADVRKDLLELRDAHINLEVDSDFAMLELRRIIERLHQLQGEDAEIEVHFNMASAVSELEAVEQAARRAGNRAGDEFSDHFTREVRRRVAATRGMFAEVEITADSSDLERDIAAVNAILTTIDERVRIGVGLDEGEILRDIEVVEMRLRELAHSDPSVRIRTNALAVLAQIEAITKLFRGQQEEMDRAHREAIEEDERRTRDHMRMVNEAYDEEERRERDKQKLVRAAYDENDRRDRERLRLLREAHDENDRFNRDLARRQGGAFGEQARRRTAGARDSLPDLAPSLRTTNVMREIARIRAEFDRLSNLTIDVDIPADQYLREIAVLEAALEAVERNEVDIATDIDLANVRSARAEIEALTQAARRGGDDAGEEWGGSFVRNIRMRIRELAATISDIPIGMDTTQAQIDIGEIRARLAALGNVRIGIDMSMADFLRETAIIEAELERLDRDDIDIQTRLEAAATRAALAALHQQINAVDRDDIEVDVDTSGGIMGLRNLAQTAGVSMGRLGALIAVGASLGTAIVPAAAAAAASISAIATAASAAVVGVGVFALGVFGPIKALQALNQYQKDSDKSAQNLSASESRVAGALDQVRGAAAGVRAAERNLIRAQRDATESVKELTRAREEARRQLEDMALAVRSNALAQRQARLDEADAKKELDKILSNPRATEAEREQARITHEQRLLQIEELGIRQGRLVADEKEARRKGVEGSEQVRAAQERIAAAVERVVDAQDSVAASQRSLAAANRALAQSYEKTGVAGGDAMRNLKEAMDALSPAGRQFALFIFSLKDDFKSLQAAAEEGLLPGLEQGIRNLLPYLEPLRTLIGNVAKALGEGFVAATEALKEPIWQEFFGYLAATAVPTLKGMFEVFGNVARGVAGILLGLSGFNGPIGEGVLQWSRDFAAWGTTLDSNKGWQKFLQYVRDSWPEVRDFFSGLWEFTKKFVAAAAPIGEWVVGAFAKLFEWMNKLDTGTWTIIIGAIAGVAAALLAVAGVTAAISTGWAGLIIAAIGLVVAEWAILYRNVEPVRRAIDATLRTIGTLAMWLWENAIKPAFTGIRNAVEVVGAIFQWLWEHVLSHVFNGWRIAIDAIWAVIQVAFGLIQIGVKALGLVWLGLYHKYIEPLMVLLRPFFKWLGEVWDALILPNMKRGFKGLSDIWDGFVKVLKIPMKFVIQTLLNDGILAAYNKVAKFFKVTPDNVKIDLPAGFATGGAVYGPGTATSDSIPARLSKGEHVWTAREVEAAGGHGMVYQLRRMVLHGLLPGFKDGGAVSGDESWFDRLKRRAGEVIGGIADFISNPTESIRKLFTKLLELVPDLDAPSTKVILGMPKRLFDMALDKVKGLFAGDGSGPGFGNWPPSPGSQRGDSGVWRSVVALIRSTGPFSGSFGNAFRPGDPLWHGSGRAVDWMGYNQDALAGFLAAHKPLELIHRTNSRDYAYTRGVNKGSFSNSLMEAHRNHIHVAMDQGGWLEPGYSMIFNGTGAPEPVLTNRQWRDINAMAGAGAKAGASYNFQFRDTTLDPGKLRALQDREDALARAGRAR